MQKPNHKNFCKTRDNFSSTLHKFYLGSSALDVAERVDDARLLALLHVPLLDHKPNVKQFYVDISQHL